MVSNMVLHRTLSCALLSVMALRRAGFLLVSLLLVTTRVVTSHDVTPFGEVSIAGAPVKAPAPAPAPAPALPPPHRVINSTKECPEVCLGRCSLHSRPNLCNRACKTCCSVCKCVPSGTAGNQETCGTCYTGWTTHGNRTKCP